MATSASTVPSTLELKRKPDHNTPAVPKSLSEVIEISDDDEDADLFPLPPAKRHQPASVRNRVDLTPVPSTSRDHLPGGSSPLRNPSPIAGAQSTPNHSQLPNGKVVKSVFKVLSPISYPHGRLNGNGINSTTGHAHHIKTSPSPSPASKPQTELDFQATNLLQQFQGNTGKPIPSASVFPPQHQSFLVKEGDKHAVDLSARYSTPPSDVNGHSQQLSQVSPDSSQRLISVEVPIRVSSGYKSTPTPRIPLSLPKQPASPRSQTSSHHLLGFRSPKKKQSEPNFNPLTYPPAKFGQQIQVVIPNRADKKLLLAELKKSTEPAEKRLSEVERLFGQTGFSQAFSVEPDLDRMRKLASKKKRTKDDLAKAPAKAMRLVTHGDLAESFSHCAISHTTARSEVITASATQPSTARHKKRQILVPPWTAASTILTDRFKEKFDPPLTFTNDFNESRLHGKFQFTDHYIVRPGIKMAPPDTNFGCQCVDGQCGVGTCQCFTKTVSDEDDKTMRREQKRTYVKRPDGVVVLSDQYIKQELDPKAKHHEITECNEFCSCGPDCWNRVVSRGRTVPLEIFQTKKCGFGVRSSVDIVKGQFIELYLGEVITETELLRREDKSDENESSYIYSLDWFAAEKNYHIDGAYFGSAMRFVNHSCNPNTRCFTVQKHKNDKKVYYLAFFAIKDIKSGVEIRIDYSGAGGVMDEDELDSEGADRNPSVHEVRCHCGEKNCRKILWAHGTKARYRRRRRRGGM